MDIRKLSRKKLRYLIRKLVNKNLDKIEQEMCNQIVQYDDVKKLKSEKIK